MKKFIKFVLVSASVWGTLCAQVFAGLLVASDFDSGTLDGWQRKNDGKTGIISNPVSGGNDGGYLLFTDGTSGGPAENILAPEQFLGDWSRALTSPESSFISLDAILFDPHVEQGNVDQIILFIEGAGGAAFIDLGLPSVEDSWQQFVAPLKQADWIITSGNWNSLLSDISAFEIQMDWVNPAGKETGIDNIVLSLDGAASVPEPGTIGLLLLVLLLLAGRSYHKNFG
ncbi:PEP-CTERM sorting domain-containing protein [Thalassomonas viridans]|uniref:PEP-CTERM sorting domain-containing protein n=1 Tax=Thalassomonas viridans TaxID=137584 RepID=A0AAE9Z8I9_9GAMM|nr:PEP-CTERM sorting domain-containing protein [Thalassomonas viridans]WDE07999.1 PEP-CTERM sorting domain-containing protein [Thalassomonas viridans]